ncbi:Protein held out wings [Camponotus floridanus]|uniref:Protein held out wings n=1 Tax=Camponotus floridanus TaxID=104421 RepID=E2ACD6_CAMFO|nr:Protein held out wings [Camponotus floridanus]
MCDNTNTTTQSIADYLSQLLKDRKQLAAFPNVFIHVERLLDEGEFFDSFHFFPFSGSFYFRVCRCSRGGFPSGVARGKMLSARVGRKMQNCGDAPFCEQFCARESQFFYRHE